MRGKGPQQLWGRRRAAVGGPVPGRVRPRAGKLACDAELAAAVCERLAHAVVAAMPISADLGALGLRVCAETIYRACYDRTGRRGLAVRTAGRICPDSNAAESPEGAQSRQNARLWASSGP